LLCLGSLCLVILYPPRRRVREECAAEFELGNAIRHILYYPEKLDKCEQICYTISVKIRIGFRYIFTLVLCKFASNSLRF